MIKAKSTKMNTDRILEGNCKNYIPWRSFCDSWHITEIPFQDIDLVHPEYDKFIASLIEFDKNFEGMWTRRVFAQSTRFYFQIEHDAFLLKLTWS